MTVAPCDLLRLECKLVFERKLLLQIFPKI